MRSSALVLLLTLLPTGVFAQEAPPAAPPDPQKPPAAVGEEGTKPTRNFASALLHNLADDVKHVPRQNSVYWLAGGGALALAVHPFDDNINQHFAGTGAADTFWKPGQIIGNTAVILGAGATAYLVGRHNPARYRRLQHLGMDEIEASILTAGLVYGLKESVRRPRPERAEAHQASGFSFPSGHAASTFAAATVLQQHLGYRAGLPTYLIASYVAMSRLHENVHNASDVVFGAAIGIVAGRSVTWHGRNFYASPMLLPAGGGIMVSIHAGPHSAAVPAG
jgi:membrane-associated phospholipid phosphatase